MTVERAGPEHAERMHHFFVREWGGEYEADRRPDVTQPQWLCIRDDEIIGYLGSLPVTFRLSGEDVAGHWLKGFWVTAAYRSGPVGPMLVEKAVGELDIVGAHVVAEPARRVMETFGVTHRCTLFNRVLLLRPGRVLARADFSALGAASRPWLRSVVGGLQSTGVLSAAGGAAGWGMRAARAVIDGSAGGLNVRRGWDVPADALDALWSRVADQVALTPVRNGRRILHRYGRGDEYEMVSVWRRDDLVGWAILRRVGVGSDPRLPGVRLALIADILYPIAEPDVGSTALRGAERLARERGADAVVCSGSHPALERALARRGYLGWSGTVQILGRDGASHRFPTGGEAMWLTRGDARSDEGF